MALRPMAREVYAEQQRLVRDAHELYPLVRWQRENDFHVYARNRFVVEERRLHRMEAAANRSYILRREILSAVARDMATALGAK